MPGRAARPVHQLCMLVDCNAGLQSKDASCSAQQQLSDRKLSYCLLAMHKAFPKVVCTHNSPQRRGIVATVSQDNRKQLPKQLGANLLSISRLLQMLC